VAGQKFENWWKRAFFLDPNFWSSFRERVYVLKGWSLEGGRNLFGFFFIELIIN
jgi:hypothetical protein